MAIEPQGSSSGSGRQDEESVVVAVAVAAAQMSMQKALDCQTFIVSLFTKGAQAYAAWKGDIAELSMHPSTIRASGLVWLADLAEFCRHLRLLEGAISEETDAMIAAAYNEHSARAVRDFKSMVDAVKLTYEPLTERMLKAAKSSASTLPKFALRDAAKAEMHANTLYSWARTFLPKETDNLAGMDKAAKLRMIPYVVSMAYAVRVKLDVHYVESG